MRPFLTFALLALIASAAHAETVLSAGSPTATAGMPFELVMTITNDDDSTLTMALPDLLHVRLETPAAVTTLEFTPDRAGPLTIAPRGFQKVRLQGSLPAGAEGLVTLTSTGIEANPVLLQVQSAPAAQTAAAPVADSKRPTPTASRLIDKPPPLAVSTYEPVFFIVGGDGGVNAKFQISFRYQLFDGDGPLASRLPWLDDLYLSFSTTSLWDLGELSKPFTDSSYRPRLFYANYDLARAMDGQLRFGVETGFGHESNGKEGDDSRSYNMFYARPTLSFGDPDGLRAYVAPLIHNYIAEDENPDLKDYRGYVDWLIGIGSRGGLDFWATLRRGTRSDYGSAELNLSYPLSKLSRGDLQGWLMLQYFGGYGESLLNYRDKLDSQLRLGIAIAL
ncbi:MAG TPA: phospholipase A [Povalibacter sp.]|uniref:phospholipase A n=1 Tax=Povalibacter sp. TaxID=1962978 RepID=UPI002CD335CA|nr:phospholipase A [Povalibacter sp.]HMN45559.1 phospholipase A [Povalibacter sp.]